MNVFFKLKKANNKINKIFTKIIFYKTLLFEESTFFTCVCSISSLSLSLHQGKKTDVVLMYFLYSSLLPVDIVFSVIGVPETKLIK
jgi:hypothetical protein